MKIRLTPLNIVSALSLMAIFALLFNKKWVLTPANEELSGLFIAVCLLVLFGSFLGDQVFRKFIPSLGRLWAVQLVIIIITIILVVILRSSFGQ